MPSIRSVGISLPGFRYSIDDVRGFGSQWLIDRPELYELFIRFLQSSRTTSRYFCLPPDELLELGGMRQRTALFEERAPALGQLAIHEALSLAGAVPSDVGSLVFTSCSCPSIPAIDALMLEGVGLSRTTSRVPVYQHGCAGGVVGLEIGSKLCADGRYVLVSSVELCSLVFQRANPTPAQLVGAAIFADGAASAVIGPEDDGLVIRGIESYLVPDSRHLMGYDLLDDGFHLRLDRELPKALAAVAPERVSQFLAEHNLTSEDISYWLFHPGGVKILDFLEATFHLRPEQARWSRETLTNVGNMSSATILFVLKAFLDSQVVKAGEKVLMLGVGPGLTIELILFEWVE